MKYSYLWVLFSLFIFCYACKKDTTTNPKESYPNYYFGKYSPSCGFVPPCSDKFWLINQEGLTQIGNSSTNVFTSVNSLGQVKENLLNVSVTNQTTPSNPSPNELSFKGIGTIINQASTINSSCYTFENASSIHNASNYFICIPLGNNDFQLINLTICQANVSDSKKQIITDILDWLTTVDEQICG
ncbi:MAG: hypothetical protein AB8G86_23335 [Saprospiraceae bacterium]